MLQEHNPEGPRGLKRAEQTMQLEVKAGECIYCTEDTDTFTPCCGVAVNPDHAPRWLCATCLKKQQLIYARAPVTSNEGRQYMCPVTSATRVHIVAMRMYSPTVPVRCGVLSNGVIVMRRNVLLIIIKWLCSIF